MSQARDLIQKIEARMTDLRAALSPDERKAFEDRYYALTDALTAGGDPDQAGQDLQVLLLDFPAAAALLGLEPAPKPPDAAAPAVAAPPTTPPKGDSVMSNQPQTQPSSPKRAKRRGFSTENFIQIFKEVVTAAIAIALVWTTVQLVASVMTYVGDETRMSQAKDVLSVMTGLLGVVMGYYFGRIPAEARAAQAQEQAAEAVQKSEQAAAQSEMVSARAEELANQASQLAVKMQVSPTLRGEPGVSDSLQRWAGEVDELRRMARTR